MTKLSSTKSANAPSMGRALFPISVADGATTGTAAQVFNGIIWAHTCEVAQCTGTTTVTLNLKDEDGTVLYTKASIAENATTFTNLMAGANDLRVLFAGVLTVELVQTTAQSGAIASHNVVLWYQR
jgi:hypothetical protein